MKKDRPRPLRRRLAHAMIFTALLLWLGFVFLVYNNRARELVSVINTSFQSTRSSLRLDVLPAYRENRAGGERDRADHILMSHLTSLTLGGVSGMDGGVALAVRQGKNVVRSQLTLGWGYEAGSDQARYLYFDQGLDDRGQLDFARWMIAHRSNWAYSIYPPGEEAGDDSAGDGTFARVTGVEVPGGAVQVQSIDLIHPDGTRERMVETHTPGQADITLDLILMTVQSVLLPSWSSNGRDGPIHMETRLANFREAQAIIDRDQAGARPVLKNWGRVSSGEDAEGLGYWLSVCCDIRANVLGEQWGLYLAALAFAAVVLLALSAHLSHKVTQPLEELSRDSGTGRCREDGPVTELNTLAAAFNAAQDQLAGQLERERAFTRAAAHELKTPLAVLRAHAEALREDIDAEKREQYLDVVLDESDRMAELVGRLLELSRLESGAPLRRERLELSALVREVWGPLSLQLEQKRVALSLKLEEVWLEGDRERLKEAVSNLAVNALRHCEEGKGIEVSLTLEDSVACLSVYNDGPPIPAEDLPHLWEPFYRGDRSRSRESGGTGLGLAIVRAAVLAHGGSCSAENRGSGVCFRVRLPLEDKIISGA